MSLAELQIDLTPKQKANLRYYLKKKNDPEFIKRQRLASAKYYNKIKDDPNFKMQVSEQKQVYYKKIKDISIDAFFQSCL